jgi:hypothetical protein
MARKFNDGGYYPVIKDNALIGSKMIAQYYEGYFYLPAIERHYPEREFTWIGKELKEDVWKGYVTQ